MYMPFVQEPIYESLSTGHTFTPGFSMPALLFSRSARNPHLQGARAPFCTKAFVHSFCTCLSYKSLLTGASCVQVLRAELRAKPIAELRTQSRGGRPGGAATDPTGLRPKGLYYKPALISPAPMRAPLRKAWDAGKSRCAQFTAHLDCLL